MKMNRIRTTSTTSLHKIMRSNLGGQMEAGGKGGLVEGHWSNPPRSDKAAANELEEAVPVPARIVNHIFQKKKKNTCIEERSLHTHSLNGLCGLAFLFFALFILRGFLGSSDRHQQRRLQTKHQYYFSQRFP